MKKSFAYLLFLLVLTGVNLRAQTLDYSNPREYTLVNVFVHGCNQVDSNVVRLLSGFPIGDKIMLPGEKTENAIDKLWKEGMFEDITLKVAKIEGEYLWLDIIVVEKPKISGSLIKEAPGAKRIKKSEKEDIQGKLGRLSGYMLTEYRKNFIIETCNDHFRADGYMNCKTVIVEKVDSLAPSYRKIDILIDKGDKVKIADIIITGNETEKGGKFFKHSKKFPTGKIRRTMKDTKQKRFYQVFKSSKYLESNYEKDKQLVLAKYYAKGYRDAKIVWDTVRRVSDNRVVIEMRIEEGRLYKFGSIKWVGNTKHSSEKLDQLLGIKPGDVYNQERLESRLYMSATGNDISSLYMDDGYLFFQVMPVEVNIHGDSIDYEMRIYEGRQATIRNVTVIGNTKTNDHVIMREIRTRPGQLFRRSDVIRSQRELASLGYFDPEKIQVNPKPDPYTGTVDIEYVVVERPSDQIELSGGWGAGRVVGTLGVSLNNFSVRNMLKGDFHPIPSGDGQKLSVRAQSNGLFFQSYNFSFTEPWLGGKKPNSLSFTFYHSIQSTGLKRSNPAYQGVSITGVSLGFGQRLKRPDDFFQLYQELNYQYYQLNNFSSVFSFANGYSNNINYRITLSRNSTDQMIYPRQGSSLKVIGQFTFPYSLFTDKNYGALSDQEKFKFVEYYKWKFTSSWFTRIWGDMVLNTRIGFGYLGMYNRNRGVSPFERFYLGGSGLTGFALDGREIIALRGYDDQSLTADRSRTGSPVGSPIIAKYTWELRYPVSLNPSATVYGLAFVEAGNTWSSFKTFNPFDVYRSCGVGVRVFLPMFGLLGLDYGYRLDDVSTAPLMQRGQVHFSIGFNLGEL